MNEQNESAKPPPPEAPAPLPLETSDGKTVEVPQPRLAPQRATVLPKSRPAQANPPPAPAKPPYFREG